MMDRFRPSVSLKGAFWATLTYSLSITVLPEGNLNLQGFGYFFGWIILYVGVTLYPALLLLSFLNAINSFGFIVMGMLLSILLPLLVDYNPFNYTLGAFLGGISGLIYWWFLNKGTSLPDTGNKQ